MMFFTKMDGYWKNRNKNVTKMGMIVKGVYCNCLEQVVFTKPCEDNCILHKFTSPNSLVFIMKYFDVYIVYSNYTQIFHIYPSYTI